MEGVRSQPPSPPSPSVHSVASEPLLRPSPPSDGMGLALRGETLAGPGGEAPARLERTRAPFPGGLTGIDSTCPLSAGRVTAFPGRHTEDSLCERPWPSDLRGTVRAFVIWRLEGLGGSWG